MTNQYRYNFIKIWIYPFFGALSRCALQVLTQKAVFPMPKLGAFVGRSISAGKTSFWLPGFPLPSRLGNNYFSL